MAITRVRDPTIVIAASTETGSTSVTFSNGATDVFVWVIGRNNTVASPASVTINSVGLTLVTDNTQTTRGHQIYWLPKASHPGNGSFTLATGAWTTNDRIGVAISEYTTGTSLTAVADNFSAGNSTNVDVAVSASSGDLTLSSCYRGGAVTGYTPDSGQTEFLDGGAWPSGCLAAVGENTGALSTVDWTVVGGTGATASGLAAVFREAAGGTTIALTGSGLTITSAAGSVVTSTSKALTGAALTVTSATGSVTPSLSLGLTGASLGILATAGQLSPASTIGLTGSDAALSLVAGDVTVTIDGSITIALSGAALTLALAAGQLTPALTKALTGASLGVTATPGSVATALTKALTGAALGISGAPGQLTPSLTKTLTSASLTITGAAGTVTASGGDVTRPVASITGTWSTVSPGVHATFEDIGPQTP